MTKSPLRLGFLASRNGSSARAIVAAIRSGDLEAEARLMVSNNKNAPALAYAAEQGVPARWSARSRATASAPARC